MESLEALLSDGRPQHVAGEGFATGEVVGRGGGGGVKGEAGFGGSERSGDLNSPRAPEGQRRPLASLGPGGREARDAGGGELGQGRLSVGQLGR